MEREEEKKEREERRERHARGIITPERTPPPSPKIREIIDGVPTEPAPYEETDEDGWMDIDGVGEEKKKKDEEEEKEEDETYGYPLREGYLLLSDSNKELINSYAEEKGKSWKNPDEVYELLANFIKQEKETQPSPRLGSSGMK